MPLSRSYFKPKCINRVYIGLGQPAPFATSNMVGRENKRMKNRAMFPVVKTNAAAGYRGPTKIELLKGAGLLISLSMTASSQKLRKRYPGAFCYKKPGHDRLQGVL